MDCAQSGRKSPTLTNRAWGTRKTTSGVTYRDGMMPGEKFVGNQLEEPGPPVNVEADTEYDQADGGAWGWKRETSPVGRSSSQG